MNADLDLGRCCICEGVENVRNVMMLSLKAPVPGTGWGCVVCNLAFDGAIAVVCDGCLEKPKALVWACDGYLAEKKRIAYDQLRGEHRHDMKFHPGEE